MLKKCQLHNIPLSGVTDPTGSAISKVTESTLLCVQFYFKEKICDFIFANSPNTPTYLKTVLCVEAGLIEGQFCAFI